MPEFSTVLNEFLNLLQPYKKLGYEKQETVEDNEPILRFEKDGEYYEITVYNINWQGQIDKTSSQWLHNNLNIPKPVPGVLQLQVEFKDKFYITGNGLNVVEIFYALPKAWHARSLFPFRNEMYYRVVKQYRSEEKRTVSYTDNFMNRINLSYFQTCVNTINSRYTGTLTNRLRSRTGAKILGFTSPVTFPPNIRKAVKELGLTLPGQYGPVRFGRSGAYKYMFNVEGVTNGDAGDIQNYLCTVYNTLFCELLRFDAVDAEEAQEFGWLFGDFLKSDCTVAGVAYGDMNNSHFHSRIVVKNGKRVELYDPWIQGIKQKKIFEVLKHGAKKYYGYEFVKVDRPPEQTDTEGSCTLNALCRAITAAEGLVTKKDLEEWVPVFVQMLVKHFRGTAMEESIVKSRQLKF